MPLDLITLIGRYYWKSCYKFTYLSAYDPS